MNRRSPGLVWLVAAAVAWGTSGTIGVGLGAASGLALLPAGALRILVGGLILLVVALVARRFRPPRSSAGWTRVIAIGLASAAYQACFFSAIGFVGVSVATLVAIGSAPAMVLAVEATTGRHRLTPRLLASLALALVGLGMLAGSPPQDVSLMDALTGTILALGAGASFATISLVGAAPNPDFDVLTGTSLAFLLGGVLVLVLALATGPVTFAVGPASVALLIALGLVPTAFAYLSYLRGLSSTTGTTGSLVSLLEPITATTLAVLVLGEVLAPIAAAGAALLLVAVGLVALDQGQSPSGPKPARMDATPA